MIEYLYNAIRLGGDYDETVTAIITDINDEIVPEAQFVIYDQDAGIAISCIEGVITESGLYEFVIPSEILADMHIGRYWYEITSDNSSICFKQPLYIV